MLVCAKQVSTAPPVPPGLPVEMSQGGASALSPLGGQRIVAEAYLRTQSSVKEIPESTTVALDYFFKFMLPRHCSQSVCSTGTRTKYPHTRHSHPLSHTLTLRMLHTWGNGPDRCCPLWLSHPQRWNLCRQSVALSSVVRVWVCSQSLVLAGSSGSFLHSWKAQGLAPQLAVPRKFLA